MARDSIYKIRDAETGLYYQTYRKKHEITKCVMSGWRLGKTAHQWKSLNACRDALCDMIEYHSIPNYYESGFPYFCENPDRVDPNGFEIVEFSLTENVTIPTNISSDTIFRLKDNSSNLYFNEDSELLGGYNGSWCLKKKGKNWKTLKGCEKFLEKMRMIYDGVMEDQWLYSEINENKVNPHNLKIVSFSMREMRVISKERI